MSVVAPVPAAVLAAAEEVRDPELPMLTLADLGVLGPLGYDGETVVVALTPTYSGCPAVAEMRADLTAALAAAGCARVRVDLVLDPPWSTDRITPRGRAALAAAGISPPGPAPIRTGPIPLRLGPLRRAVDCPRCATPAERVAEFGSTACTALYRCPGCGEPFEHLKEV